MNSDPRRDGVTAGAEPENSKQSQCTGSSSPYQPIANAIADVSEVCSPRYRWGDALQWAQSRLSKTVVSTSELDAA
jgi:hypothetical protein